MGGISSLLPSPRLARLSLTLLLSPLLLFLLFLLLDHLSPFPFHALERPSATLVTDHQGEPLRFFLPADDRWRFPVRLQDLPPEVPAAFIASEDRRFGRHPGVDPVAVARAAVQNLRARRVVSGASTLAMQVARLAEPAPRTLTYKIKEAFRALQLTWHRSDAEILEAYLNLAPFGGNLEGIGAASWRHFGKAPERLAPGEIALLVALPRAPTAYDPARNPKTATVARDRVLDQLAERGDFTEEQAARGKAVPVPTARRPLPFEAPHAARGLASAHRGAPLLTSTLDLRLQRLAEAQVRRRIEELRAFGLGNVAVVVVERPGRQVRALVGSADFFDNAHQGQIDGTRARRSPGSTLKPWLYALAFDAGWLHPSSWLLDVPTDFSGYVAENYDGAYRGKVTARVALAESLNAPAVRVLARYGLEPYWESLRAAGLETLDRPAGHYGLPLVLGAGEVTLSDLTNFYATLGDEGVHRPLRWLENAPTASTTTDPASGEALPQRSSEPVLPHNGQRLLSAAAARETVRILLDPRRPDLPDGWALTRDVPEVAWKTGTSFGHRDAWAVGLSRRYAIGVWVGHFDGRVREGTSGSEHAGPLLFDLFRALDPGGAGPLPNSRRPIPRAEVCAHSHQRPGPYCPKILDVTVLPGVTELEPCPLHRRLLVDAATGQRLASHCLADRKTYWHLATLDPPELIAWRRAQGLPVTPLPPFAPGCADPNRSAPLQILSPDPSTPYRLRPSIPREHQKIPLIAQTDPTTTQLWWYLNGLLLTSAKPGERLFLEPEVGEHQLVVTDDLGRSVEVGWVVE
ncbi:MAG: penicillin-binding protein 1C [Acidobacteriota bacterium]